MGPVSQSVLDKREHGDDGPGDQAQQAAAQVPGDEAGEDAESDEEGVGADHPQRRGDRVQKHIGEEALAGLLPYEGRDEEEQHGIVAGGRDRADGKDPANGTAVFVEGPP